MLERRLALVSMREILSAMPLSLLVTCAVLMPTGLLIMRAAWMQPSDLPARDALLTLVIYVLEVVLLLANMRPIGWGSVAIC